MKARYNKMNVFDVIIIGGGASGLISAIEAAKRGLSICIIERLPKLGKKLLATGNGRCNMTNLQLQEKDYRSEIPTFPYEVIHRFSAQHTLHYFEKLGVLWKEEKGYVYPRSEQATTVVNALELKVQALGISVYYEKEVISLDKTTRGFDIKLHDGTHIFGEQCILATGGKAQSKLGSNGSGYQLAKRLGHKIVPVVPALTGLHTNHKAVTKWAGVRAKAGLTCKVDGQTVFKEQGEVQFTNYGISGVPTFQVSRFATYGLERGKSVFIELDFALEYTKEQLYDLIERFIHTCSYKNIRELLEGIFSKKLVPIFLKEVNFVETIRVYQLKKQQIQALVSVIKSFSLPIIGCNSFEQAQVCAGGVSVKEVDVTTMESKKVKGLYFVGELLDVDGTCGGYNLQWAWASGYLAGNSVQKREHTQNMQTRRKK